MKKRIIVISAVIVALFIGTVICIVSCSNSKDNPDKILDTIKNNASIDVTGVYDRISSLSGEASIQSKQSFKGRFEEIENFKLKKEKKTIIANFTATVKDDAYKLVDKQAVTVVLQRQSKDDYTITGVSLDNNQALYVTAAVPFANEMICEKNGVITFEVPEEKFNKEKYIFNESITAELDTFGLEHVYLVTLPINKNTVKNIELLPRIDEEPAIDSTPFEMIGVRIKYTLANDIIISDISKITYVPENQTWYVDFGKCLSYERLENVN